MAFCRWQCDTAGTGTCTLVVNQDGLPVELMEFSVEPEGAGEGEEEEAGGGDGLTAKTASG